MTGPIIMPHGLPSIRKLINKADIAVSNLQSQGGYLNPIQGATFIRMLQEKPTLLNEVRVVPMNGPVMEINKIGFGSRILRAAPASGTALDPTLRASPTLGKVTLTTVEVCAEVLLPYDVLEDNIERGNLETTFMDLIAERVSVDLEEFLVLADTLSSDTFLAKTDGLLKLISTHVVNYSSPVTSISKTIFKNARKAMPNKYLRRGMDMKHFVSPDLETEYADSLASRLTTLGDARVETNYIGAMSPYGTPIQAVAPMPDANMVMTFPKNIILGIQRDLMIESARDIRARGIVIVATLRIDVKIEEEDATVRTNNLAPNDITTTTA